MCVCVLDHLSSVRFFETLWTVARQIPLSMGFFRQEYWSGLSCPPPGDPPNPGIEPKSLTSPALAGEFFTTSTTWEDTYLCKAPLTLRRLQRLVLDDDRPPRCSLWGSGVWGIIQVSQGDCRLHKVRTLEKGCERGPRSGAVSGEDGSQSELFWAASGAVSRGLGGCLLDLGRVEEAGGKQGVGEGGQCAGGGHLAWAGPEC